MGAPFSHKPITPIPSVSMSTLHVLCIEYAQFQQGYNPPYLQQPSLPLPASVQQPLPLPQKTYSSSQQMQQYFNPPRPTELHAQPITIPNNRPPQPIQNIELQPFPTYVIIAFPLNEIQLRSQQTVNKNKSAAGIREENSQVELEDKTTTQTKDEKNNEIKEPQELLEPKEPPFLERLFVKKTEIPT